MTHARAAPPAPRTRTVASAGTHSRSSKARRNPYRSVLSPTSRRPWRVIVLTAPIRRASSLASSTRGSTASLCGIVTFAQSGLVHLTGLVPVWQAEGGERGIVHGRRQRMAHRLPDEIDGAHVGRRRS